MQYERLFLTYAFSFIVTWPSLGRGMETLREARENIYIYVYKYTNVYICVLRGGEKGERKEKKRKNKEKKVEAEDGECAGVRARARL